MSPVTRARVVRSGLALLLLLGGAAGLYLTVNWLEITQTAAGAFDDADAQLRVRQAASAVSAAGRDVEAARKKLEVERQRVVETEVERDLNRSMIAAFEKELRNAEAWLRECEARLKEVLEARARGRKDQASRATRPDRGEPSKESPRPLQSFRDCPTCPEMVPLPPGSFMMGPAPGEEDREGVPKGAEDGPTHRVTIGYSFSIGRYEVTRAEYAAFVAATSRPDASVCNWRSPGFTQTDRDPVVCVSWDDASAYVAWLSRTTGKTYRLPSEAEWEYAARAGSQAARYWGDSREEACRYGNFADLTTAATLNWAKTPDRIFLCSDGHVYTAPVGRFQANGFGLHDMLGNAWEWVGDCYNSRYDGAPEDGRTWLAGDCSRRMLRGGSWFNLPRDARAAGRDVSPAGDRYASLGFRVARTN